MDGPELAILDYYLPQVEDSGVATSRALVDRVQDKYMINTQFKLPVLVKIKTQYVEGFGIRGICDTTTNLKSGFTFAIANNKLNFRLYSSTGVQLYNLFSPSFSNSGSTEFGVFISDIQVKFYVNQILLSTHPVSMIGYSHNGRMVVGSLDSSNKTVNSEIMSFAIVKEEYV